MRYICSICGYVYDETGNTPWADLPDDWKCPLCGAAKSDFIPEGKTGPEATAVPDENVVQKEPDVPGEKIPVTLQSQDMRELRAIEASVLCSNLAKGCEKQYQAEQAAAFRKLSDWFGAQAEAKTDPSFAQLLDLVNADLTAGYPAANTTAGQNGDRGALRCLAWSEKTARILKSILSRYAREGEAMLENTGIYVCTV